MNTGYKIYIQRLEKMLNANYIQLRTVIILFN